MSQSMKYLERIFCYSLIAILSWFLYTTIQSHYDLRNNMITVVHDYNKWISRVDLDTRLTRARLRGFEGKVTSLEKDMNFLELQKREEKKKEKRIPKEIVKL